MINICKAMFLSNKFYVRNNLNFNKFTIKKKFNEINR